MHAWPKAGPRLVWKITGLGDGYSTPSIAQGKIFLMGVPSKSQTVKRTNKSIIALNVKDGKKIWSTPIGVMAGGYPGPRCTPTVDGDFLYAVSSDGKLVRASVKDGKISWSKDIRKEFQGAPGGWMYTESPLIDNDVLVCTPGGNKSAIVAMKKETGEVIWKTAIVGVKSDKKNKKTGEIQNFNTGAAYSSVVSATINGTHQYVQFLAGGVIGVDAKTGKFLWHYDAPANGINCSTPIVHDNTVFAASAYGVGGGLARITNDGSAQEVYFRKEMQNHHGGMILIGDYLYGTGSGTLICLDYKTGKIAWNERGVGKGSIAYADGLLFHRSEGGKGPISLVEATPKGYVEKGRFDQPDRSKVSAWSHPVVAGGRLYLRDWDILLCYDVKADNGTK